MPSSPTTCPSCGSAVPEGSARCPACSKVLSDDSRCPKCGSTAPVNEVGLGRYACAMCGGERTLGEGTVVATSLADNLLRRARNLRLAMWVFRLLGVGSLAVGAVVGGLLTLLSSTGAVLAGVGFAGLAVSSWWLSRRLGKDAATQLDAARDHRLLSAGAQHTGVTAATAARVLAIGEGEADAALTQLAKQGKMELDVDDDGVVRYRVADPEELEQLLSGPKAAHNRR